MRISSLPSFLSSRTQIDSDKKEKTEKKLRTREINAHLEISSSSNCTSRTSLADNRVRVNCVECDKRVDRLAQHLTSHLRSFHSIYIDSKACVTNICVCVCTGEGRKNEREARLTFRSLRLFELLCIERARARGKSASNVYHMKIESI